MRHSDVTYTALGVPPPPPAKAAAQPAKAAAQKRRGPRGGGTSAAWHTAWYRAKAEGPVALAMFVRVFPKPMAYEDAGKGKGKGL